MWWALLGAWGCGEGSWAVETWGGARVEEGVPSDELADGCGVVFDRFIVSFVDVAVVDGRGALGGALPADLVVDLTRPGPRPLGVADVPPGPYAAVRVRIAPPAEPVGVGTDQAEATRGASVWVSGEIACPGRDPVRFDWRFDADTRYTCAPEDLTIARGGLDRTQLTVRGEHLLYDALVSPDAALRGLPIAAADADADGEVTLSELAAVPLAPLGYDVGPYAAVEDLGAFVAHLSRTIVHVDGEAGCGAEL